MRKIPREGQKRDWEKEVGEGKFKANSGLKGKL